MLLHAHVVACPCCGPRMLWQAHVVECPCCGMPMLWQAHVVCSCTCTRTNGETNIRVEGTMSAGPCLGCTHARKHSHTHACMHTYKSTHTHTYTHTNRKAHTLATAPAAFLMAVSSVTMTQSALRARGREEAELPASRKRCTRCFRQKHSFKSL